MLFQTLLETPIPRVYIRAKAEGQEASEAHFGKPQFIAGHREPYLVGRRLLAPCLGCQRAAEGSSMPPMAAPVRPRAG